MAHKGVHRKDLTSVSKGRAKPRERDEALRITPSTALAPSPPPPHIPHPLPLVLCLSLAYLHYSFAYCTLTFSKAYVMDKGNCHSQISHITDSSTQRISRNPKEVRGSLPQLGPGAHPWAGEAELQQIPATEYDIGAGQGERTVPREAVQALRGEVKNTNRFICIV